MDGRHITKSVALAATALVLATAAPAAGGTPSAATRARHDLLAPSAFPAGWTRSPNVGSDVDQVVPPRRVAACIGVRVRSIPAHPPKATSPEYVETSAQASVTEGVVVYPTLAGAGAAFGALAARRAPTCAATYLNHRIAKGTGTYAVTRLAVATPVGRSCGLAIALSVTLHGTTVTADEDEVVVQVRGSEAILTLASVGSPFPRPLAERLAASAARRLA